MLVLRSHHDSDEWTDDDEMTLWLAVEWFLLAKAWGCWWVAQVGEC